MDGSHPVNQRIWEEFSRLHWLYQDAWRQRDNIAICLWRLLEVAKSEQLTPPQRVDLLIRIGQLVDHKLAAPRELPSLDLTVAQRLIMLGEATDGSGALVAKNDLAVAYERVARILYDTGRINWKTKRQLIDRAKQLRSPAVHAFTGFVKDVAINASKNYLNARFTWPGQRQLPC